MGFTEEQAREMMERTERNRKKRPGERTHPAPVAPTVTPGKRIRQSAKPLMNKLESQWYSNLLSYHPGNATLRSQAMRFKLGNGIWYKPDFTVTVDGKLIAYEVKGPKAWRGGFENLKVVAHAWPEHTFILVWKENGDWKQQHVLP